MRPGWGARRRVAHHRLATLVAAACALAAVLSWQAPRAKAAAGFVHAVEQPGGGQLVDGAGTPVHFRGVQLECWLLGGGPCWGGGSASESEVFQRLANLVGAGAAARFRADLYSTFVNGSDIRRAAELGFNLVRVPINHVALDAGGELGWKALDDLVASAERYGVYVIFDLHAAPSPQSRQGSADYPASSTPPATLWAPAGRRAETMALWQAIASRYRDRRSVAGYDLLNEPNTEGHSGDLVALYRKIIAAIRQFDTNHLVILEGDSYGSDLSAFQSALDPNQAYTFHTYNHTGDPETQSQLSYFDGFSMRQGVPLLNGEFGQNTDSWVAQTRALLEQPSYRVQGWVFWNWKAVYNPGPFENQGLGYGHLVEGFQPTPAWQRTIDYLSGALVTPNASSSSLQVSPAEATRGMAEFLQTVTLSHTHETPSLLRALGSSQ